MPSGVPLMAEAAAMIASYLDAERKRGRIASDAEVDMLAPTVIGAAHLLLADRLSGPPEDTAVDAMVTTVLADVVRQR